MENAEEVVIAINRIIDNLKYQKQVDKDNKDIPEMVSILEEKYIDAIITNLEKEKMRKD